MKRYSATADIGGVTGPDSPLLYRSVFDCQTDGVIAVGFNGVILLFNEAAGRILGMSPDSARDRLFAEVLLIEGLDEFNQAVVDAISDRSVGERRTLSVHRGGKRRTIAATTSYLRNASDASAHSLGVIVVFSDLTEIEELREAEARTAEMLRAQHAELQQAYRRIEESSAALKSTMRKFQIVRVAATCLVIALFVAAGVYSWGLGPFGSPSAAGYADGAASPPPEAWDGAELRTVVVRPRPLTSSISLTGKLAPWRRINVTSPISAKISTVHFQYGQAVRKGDRLVELHTAEIRRQHRDARRDYLKALKDFNELQNWNKHPEVAQARRALTRAQAALRNQENELESAALLAEQGIIPAKQHEAAQRQYLSQQLDFESARQNLDIVLARNSEENRQVAQLALDNARERMRSLEEGLQGGDIRAPISGVVLDTREAGTEPGIADAKGLARGQPVQEGQVLLTIGDLSRMSVVTSVDEVQIPNIGVGRRLRAAGDAFPGLSLEGAVSHVSSEARSRDQNALPAFEVVGLLDELDAAERGRLRPGMSVDVDILAYRNPDALTVPLEAVTLRHGARWVKVRDRDTLRIRDVEVETGATTVNAVEILSGISANDEIVLPGH